MSSRLRAAYVILSGIVIFGAFLWLRAHETHGPGQAGMASATVIRQSPATDGRTDLTVSYTVDGKTRQITKSVETSAFSSQGRIVWVCFDPTDPSSASLRLPEDPLCGQS
ncbi:hypothetical protein BKA23_0578 [Rudaeicoccus suwonensis]|uniref:DUF3592 domain-containing protein n=2 Tax=Rudaeicoccus suwonensis TaxID=657409 RepID=A0A561E850_9MICO|nr:hypothetical protein BKA23_0578 [Rudaeicoccus suwonensis]